MAYRQCMDCGTPTPSTRCEPCTIEWRSARDYNGDWPAIRARQLLTYPLCRVCGAVASEVDHIIRLRDGGSHAPANLQSLCKLHHQRKTNAERDGRAVPTAEV